MDKTEELLTSTLEGLSRLQERLQEIADVEKSFDARLNALTDRVDALFNRQKELLDDLNHLETMLSDINQALDRAKALQQSIAAAGERFANLDVQGLSQALEDTRGEIDKATTKILAAEKRTKDNDKKKLGKK